MKIWVTGIAGFLGSHLADALEKRGHIIGGNDALICGDKYNTDPDYLRIADCRDFDVMSALFNHFRPDVVVHCAATAHEGLSSFSPSFITSNIYEASVATFSAAIASGAKRIVYMSSMSRYGTGKSQDGNANNPPFGEDTHVTAPVDPYGIAKVAAEETLKVLCETHHVKWSIAVPHNIIGLRQRYVDPYRNVASIMINRCKQGKGPIVYGNGSQKRCFSPVMDCLPSLVRMIEGYADGHTVNIGPDRGEITITDLALLIKKLTQCDEEIIYVPGRPNEVHQAFTTSDKARELLGYKEQQPLISCLTEMVLAVDPKPFIYDFPIEIVNGKTPETWTKRLM